jgi:hypothetical protein
MSNNSTSARAFSQILHRVRNLKDDTILIYIGDLYYSENTILYYPECLENNLLESYETKSGLEITFKNIINVKNFIQNIIY